MNIITTSCWDEEFFSNWVKFKNTLYEPRNYLIETIEDLRKVLCKPERFPDDSWVALTIESDGNIQGRCLVAVNSKNSMIAKVGYIEFIDDLDKFRIFWKEIEKVATEMGAKEIKGPIDLNFFINYRWKTWGKAAPFFREPQQKSYYIDFFDRVGMKPIKTWETFRLKYFQSWRNYGQIRKASGVKRPKLKLTVRDIDLSNFESELEMFYGLLTKSFEQMSEFEPIPLETFKGFYLDYKALINSRFVSFAMYEGKEVGFCINYFDPLKILMQRQRWSKILPSRPVDIWTLFRLRMNYSRLLIIYIGKVPGPNGEDFKGVQGVIAKKQTPWILATMPHLLSCYNAEDSPSRKGFHPKQIKVIAKYAIFGKQLK